VRTCLVVDDSQVVRMVARKIIEALGFAGSEAADGRAALEACRTSLPDAVLVDWNMPAISGIDFVKALRAMPGGDKPAVVFCTHEGSAARMEEALRAGADEYIVKPFDGEVVLTKFLQVGLL
jgi:two-component system chemotaxis response regulator CheY